MVVVRRREVQIKIGSSSDNSSRNDLGSAVRLLFNETLTFNTIDDTVDNENAKEHVEK